MGNGGFSNVEGELEAFRFCSARDMQVLEIGDHIVIERRSLLRAAFAALGNNAHGQMLILEFRIRGLDTNNRWRTKKALFAAVRFLSDGCVETENGGHGHDAGVIHGQMVTDYSTYL